MKQRDSSTLAAVSQVSSLWIWAWRTIIYFLSILWGSEGWPDTLGWQNQEKNEKNNWKVRFDNGHSSENHALNWYKRRLVSFQGKSKSTHYLFLLPKADAASQAMTAIPSQCLSRDIRLTAFLSDSGSTLMSRWKIIKTRYMEIF